MFERFQLPDVAAVARRTMLSALAVGVLGLVLLLLFNQTWGALGLCIGIALGIGNFRLIVRSVLKVGRRGEGDKRRPLAMNTLGRLMSMTVVALVLAWVKPALGLGIIGGLALFQFLLLGNVTRSMLKAGVAGTVPGGGGLAFLLGASGLGDPLGSGDAPGAGPVDTGDLGEPGEGAGGEGTA
ncbi:MAG: hypothetical protein ACRDXC_03020 [Acidimicrobiales bacterium]